MERHTPGPWTTGDADFHTIVGSVTRFGTDNGGNKWLAAVCVVDKSDNEAEDLANARLIAAAPDLAAALKLAREWASRDSSGCSPTFLRIINAALAKAGVA